MTISSTAVTSTEKSSKKTSSKSRRSVRPFYPPPSADLETPWTIKVYNAYHEHGRWERYNEIANQIYAQRNLKAVGEERRVDIEKYPTYFIEATIDGSAPFGGIRVHTANSEGEFPLHEELSGYINMKAFRSFTDDLQVDGLAHLSAFWIDPSCRMAGVAGDIARAGFALCLATSSKWNIGAAHQYIQNAWESLGWYSVPQFETFPYPDDRYESFVICGSKETWPTELTEWAEDQTQGVSLNGLSVRFTVEPMRT